MSVGVVFDPLADRNEPVGLTNVREARQLDRCDPLVAELMSGRLLSLAAHPHVAGRCRRLESRREVDGAAHDRIVAHPPRPDRAGNDDAGVDTRAPFEGVVRAGPDALDGLQAGSGGQYSPLEIVGVGVGSTEESDQAVATKGVHVAVVVLNDARDNGEHFVGEVAQLLGIEIAGEGAERRKIDEYHTHSAPLTHPQSLLQLAAAHAAKAHALWIGGAANSAGHLTEV